MSIYRKIVVDNHKNLHRRNSIKKKTKTRTEKDENSSVINNNSTTRAKWEDLIVIKQDFSQWLNKNINKILAAQQIENLKKIYYTSDQAPHSIDKILVENDFISREHMQLLERKYQALMNNSSDYDLEKASTQKMNVPQVNDPKTLDKIYGTPPSVNQNQEISQITYIVNSSSTSRAQNNRGTTKKRFTEKVPINKTIATINCDFAAQASKNLEEDKTILTINTHKSEANSEDELQTINVKHDQAARIKHGENDSVKQMETERRKMNQEQQETRFFEKSLVKSEKGDIKRIGQYRIIRLLGEGNFGKVYLVFNEHLKVEQALKIIYTSGQKNREETIRRFFREAQAIAKLRHPNIASAYDIGEIDGVNYYTMDYIKGKNLKDIVEKNKRMPTTKAIEIIYKVANALHYAHQHKIIHRDIKPENIMVAEDTGEPYVMDFGLARQVGGNEISQTGNISGTPAYMSPEQTLGRNSKLDHRTDIYSLGVTLYKLLTGKTPFASGNMLEVLQKVSTEEPIPPRELVATIPRKVEEICLKAMSKNRELRYPHAKAFANALEPFLHNKVKHTRTREVRAEKNKKNHSLYSTVAAFLPALVVLIVMYIYSAAQNSQILGQMQQLRVDNSNLEQELNNTKEIEKQQRTRLVSKDRELRKQKNVNSSLQKQLLIQRQEISQLKSYTKGLQKELDKLIANNPQTQKSLPASIFRGNEQRTGSYYGRAIRLYPNNKWSRKIHMQIQSSPIVYKNRVFIGGYGSFNGFDITGNNDLRFPLQPGIPATTACVYKDFVLFGFKNKVHMLNIKGFYSEHVFYASEGAKVTATPLVYEDKLYFAATDGCVYAFDLKTKKPLWRQQLSGEKMSEIAIDGKHLYIGNEKGYVYALHLQNKKKGKWRHKIDSAVVAISIDEDNLYVTSKNGKVYCLDAKTTDKAKRQKWLFATENTIESGVAMARDRVFVTSTDKALHAVDENGKLMWKFTTQSAIKSSPVFIDGVVYCASTDDYLYGIDAIDGKEIWKHRIGYNRSSFTVYNNTIYVTANSSGGTLYAVTGQ